MRIYLTGASGFVGSNLARVFAAHGAELVTPGHEDVDLTDPAPYFVCIGAAQTFGCFVAKPYPSLLADALDMRVVNLGLGSATPSVFGM